VATSERAGVPAECFPFGYEIQPPSEFLIRISKSAAWSCWAELPANRLWM